MGEGLSKTVLLNADGSLTGRQVALAVPGALLWSTGSFSMVDLARRNWATGRKLPVTGTLTAGATYLLGKGKTNFLRLGFKEPTEWTWFGYLKKDDTSADNAHCPVPIGAYGGASLPGMLCYWPIGVAGFRAQAYDSLGQRTPTVSISSPELMKKYCAICTKASLTIKCVTDSSSNTVNFLGPRAPGNLAMRLLSSNSQQFAGNQGQYHQGFYPFALNGDQQEEYWDQVDKHADRDEVVENA